MYPELIHVGDLAVHSYGLMISLAILISAFLLYRKAPHENINPDHVLEAIIVASFFGLLGSRILYMALNWQLYSGRFFTAFFTQFEGLTFYGAFFGGIIALFVWSMKRGVNFLKFTDFLAPYLALGYALGRIGCFFKRLLLRYRIDCSLGPADQPWRPGIEASRSTLRCIKRPGYIFYPKSAAAQAALYRFYFNRTFCSLRSAALYH